MSYRQQNNVGRPVRIGLEPRDKRTSIAFQKSSVVMSFILSFFVFVLIGGVSQVHNYCCSSTTSDSVLYISFILIAAALIVFFMNLLALINEKYVWYTSTFYQEKWYGQDVEDPDPFILAEDGHKMVFESNVNMQKLHEIIDTNDAEDRNSERLRGDGRVGGRRSNRFG